MQSGKAPREMQAQSSARLLPFHSRVDLLEALKDAGVVFGCDANASVGDCDLDAVATGRCRQRDR